MEKPFLFDIVDFLYDNVMDNAPEFLQQRSMSSAFTLGFLGNYFLVKGIQKISEKIMNKEFNHKYLPIMEKGCIGLTAGAPFVYGLIDPQGLQEIMTKHPTYTSGMIGAGLGAIYCASKDINKKKLENLI